MKWLRNGAHSREPAPNPATLDLARQVGALCAIPAIMLRMSFERLNEGLLANLSPDDRSSVLVGTSKLRPRARLYVYGWFFQAAPVCPSPEYCLKTRMSVLRSLKEYPSPDILRPLMLFSHWSDGVFLDEHDCLCSACESAASKCYDKGERELWAELPSIFGLLSWEELLQESRLE
jgi:hypothetical protein